MYQSFRKNAIKKEATDPVIPQRLNSLRWGWARQGERQEVKSQLYYCAYNMLPCFYSDLSHIEGRFQSAFFLVEIQIIKAVWFIWMCQRNFLKLPFAFLWVRSSPQKMGRRKPPKFTANCWKWSKRLVFLSATLYTLGNMVANIKIKWW